MGKLLPPPDRLLRNLNELAEHYAEHARITSVPLDAIVARLLADAVALTERPNMDALADVNWFKRKLKDGFFDQQLHVARRTKSQRPTPPRVYMTVADAASMFGWSKNTTRKWIRTVKLPMTRFGNRDLVNRADFEKVAKIRARKRRERDYPQYISG